MPYLGFQHRRCDTSQPWATPTEQAEGSKGPEEYHSHEFFLSRLTANWAVGPAWDVSGRWPLKAIFLRDKNMGSAAE